MGLFCKISNLVGGMSLVTRESWLLRYMSLWKIFVGLLWMDFGWKYVVECWWFWYGSVSEMGFLAEGEVSLGKNRRQRWEKFINHRTIFFVFFCLGCGVFWKERNGGGGGGVVLNYRGQRWKWGIFPPISWRVFLVSHPRVKTSDTVDNIYIFSF